MEENNKPLQPQTTPTSQKQEVKAPKISVILMLVFVLGLTAKHKDQHENNAGLCAWLDSLYCMGHL